MTDLFRLADDLGPAKIIHVHEPGIGLRAVLVVDNVARGPAIGGLRMAPDVSVEECFRLARAMTMKNAAAGLAHGGGKSVLWGDPRMQPERKEALIRTFAHALRNESDYIFGPDMGTDETCMAWVKDEIGRSVGLPAALGGIPLDELGATGWGLAHCAAVAAPFAGLALDRQLESWRLRVDAELDRWLPPAGAAPSRLHAAQRYSVLGGGKRIRPALVYATAETLQLPLALVDGAACAVELIHSYSLVHDDLPAMDDDDLRRGRPTCHRAVSAR